jgi:hypothetical protein
LFFFSSVAEVLNHLNSNQRLLRSHPKSSNNSTTTSNNHQTTNNHPPQSASNVFNTAAAAITSRFISDPQGRNFSESTNHNDFFSLYQIDPTVNFISPSAYSLVNPDLASYAADAFVYSQLSDLNYRSVSEPTSSSSSSNNHHPTRMSPYARQSFYPMYTQRDIHSPSRTTADYA